MLQSIGDYGLVGVDGFEPKGIPEKREKNRTKKGRKIGRKKGEKSDEKSGGKIRTIFELTREESRKHRSRALKRNVNKYRT